MADGMAAGHLAAQAAIKARRPDLPVGLSLAIVDDVVGRRRPVGARPQAGRGLRRGGCGSRATTTSSASRTTSGSAYDGDGAVAAPEGRRVKRHGLGHRAAVARRGRALRARGRAGVPVLVTEHGMAHRRRQPAGGLHRAVARRAARRDRRRRPGPRLLPLDAHGQLRVDLRLRPPARAALRRPRDVRPHPQAERRGLRLDRPCARRRCTD